MSAMRGVVTELWRYPVKSLGGERCDALLLDRRGVEHDREWAFVDPEGGIASGKTTRRFRKVLGLMHHVARLGEDGEPEIELADGRVARPGDPALDELVPPGWALGREDATPHHDAGAIHLVTTATLRWIGEVTGEPLPVTRLRPNVLVEADAIEDGWVGRRLRLGEVELHVTGRTERCVMVGHPQRGLEPRPRLLQTIGRINDVCAGVYADVVRPGRIRVGDALELD